MPNEPSGAMAVSLRIGWWSADLHGLTGQAIVTSRVVALLKRVGATAFLYRGERLKSFGSWLWSALRLTVSLPGRRVQVLYLVCSRSTAGFLRDFPAYLTQFFGVRVMVHVHGSDIVGLCQRPWVGPIARFLLARCELIVPSVHLLAPLRGLGVRQVHLCENFSEYVESSGASVQPAQAGSGSRPWTILWNSNVMASKGFFAVAEAVRSMAEEGMPVRLIALGRPIGDEVMDLRACQDALLRLLGLGWIEHPGQVDRAAAMRLLHEADVVCLPSRYSSECQPLAVIEAMCAGRQLVIADTPALLATVGDYPCEKVSGPVATEVRFALQRIFEKPVNDEALQAAVSRARLRFSPERFDCDMARLLRV